MLRVGTRVLVHGLASAGAAPINGSEGVCTDWLKDEGRMEVSLLTGPHKDELVTVRPVNLRKILKKGDDGELIEKIKDIFRSFDVNGDGMVDTDEMHTVMKILGLEAFSLDNFLDAVDKDGDGSVEYEEFVEWAMSPVDPRMQAATDAILDEVCKPDAKKSGLVRAKTKRLEDELLGAQGEESVDTTELSLEELETQIETKLPPSWPEHGLRVVNNMRAKFPDYPLKNIMILMMEHNYVGGKVSHAIRLTATREVEVMQLASVCPAEFPCAYQCLRQDGLQVFPEGCKDWSFKNLRDLKLYDQWVGRINYGDKFTILEVCRGHDYSFHFGLIEFENHQPGADPMAKYWVNLGLELHTDMFSTDLNYSAAMRAVSG